MQTISKLDESADLETRGLSANRLVGLATSHADAVLLTNDLGGDHCDI
jgi:hypothetical protein